MNNPIALMRNNIVWQAAGETGAAVAEPKVAEPKAEAAPVEAPSESLLGVAGAPEKVGGEPTVVSPVTAEFTALQPDEIKAPEGVELVPETVEAFLTIMNDQALSRAELAQKLVDLQVSESLKANEAATVAAQTLWTETQAQWQKDAKALPDIGGDKLPETLSTIKRGLDVIGADKAFYEAMDLTGAGNHPAIIRVLFAATKGLVEGAPISGTPPKGALSQADKLFGGIKE